MPDNFASSLLADDRSACDLVIDTFDAMHLGDDLTLLACHHTIGGTPAVASDAGR